MLQLIQLRLQQERLWVFQSLAGLVASHTYKAFLVSSMFFFLPVYRFFFLILSRRFSVTFEGVTFIIYHQSFKWVSFRLAMHAGTLGSGLFKFHSAINGGSFIRLFGLNCCAGHAGHGTVWTGKKILPIAELLSLNRNLRWWVPIAIVYFLLCKLWHTCRYGMPNKSCTNILLRKACIF